MFFERQGGEQQHRDDAKMHHFLDTNLYRARPRVRHFSIKSLDIKRILIN